MSTVLIPDIFFTRWVVFERVQLEHGQLVRQFRREFRGAAPLVEKVAQQHPKHFFDRYPDPTGFRVQALEPLDLERSAEKQRRYVAHGQTQNPFHGHVLQSLFDVHG
jgi:hypothetical protein